MPELNGKVLTDIYVRTTRKEEIRASRRRAAREEYLAYLALLEKGAQLAIWRPDVLNINKARILDLSHWNAQVNYDAISPQVASVILKSGGMDGGVTGWLYEDKTYATRLHEFYIRGVPPETYFFGTPDYHLFNQHKQEVIKEQPYDQNPIIKRIIDTNHIGPWTWDTLRPDSGWKRFYAWWLDMEDEMFGSQPITDSWQAVTMENILDGLHLMIQREKFPDVHLGTYLRPLWLKKYPAVQTYLHNRRDWLWLWYAQWVHPVDPDVALVKLSDVWDTWSPPDSMNYLYMLDGFEQRVQVLQYTGEKFDAPELGMDEVDANLGFDTKEKFHEWLKWTTTPTPPPPPPPPQPGETQLDRIERQVAELRAHFK